MLNFDVTNDHDGLNVVDGSFHCFFSEKRLVVIYHGDHTLWCTAAVLFLVRQQLNDRL